MPPNNKEPAPQLRVKSRFHPLMQLWRHPVRLTVSLLLIVFLLPETAALGAKFLGWPAALSYLVSALFVFALVIAPQFLAAYINCRHVRYDFYGDHLSFTENFLLRDPIRVPYRSVAGLRVARSALQKRVGLGDIVIETRPARHLDLRGVDHVIEDVAAAEKHKAKIEKIIAAWRAAQENAQSTSPAGAGATASPAGAGVAASSAGTAAAETERR